MWKESGQRLPETGTSAVTEDVYLEYLASLLAGDRANCRRIVLELLAGTLDIRDLYLNLFHRSLYDVGDLWERHCASVAVEHLAAAITESLMNLAYPLLFARVHTGKSAIVACTANESHQIGCKMVADILELHGWHAYFLGANTPTPDLASMIEAKRPVIVALSLSLSDRFPDLFEALDMIRGRFPSVRILVGGQAFRHASANILVNYPGVACVPSLTALEALLQSD